MKTTYPRLTDIGRGTIQHARRSLSATAGLLKRTSRCALLALLAFGGVHRAHAADYSFASVFTFGNSGSEEAQTMTKDSSGNVYLLGNWSGAIDVDPGPGVSTLNGSGDSFVAKYSPGGTLIWATRLGDNAFNFSPTITLDSNNNVYIAGDGTSTAGDWDDGPGTVITDGQRIFAARVNSDGTFGWVRTAGGTNANSRGNSLIVDAAGNIVVAANFRGSNADFDPGAGSALLTTGNAVAGNLGSVTEGVLWTLTSSGDFVSVKKFDVTAASSATTAVRVAQDASGTIHVLGTLAGSVDLDPGAGTSPATAVGSGDLFLVRMDAAQNFLGASIIGSPQNEIPRAMKVVGTHVYLTGAFSGTVDFDPGAGIVELTGAGADDAFVVKMTSSGDLVWAKSAGGTGADIARALEVAADGNVIVVGYSNSTDADFDPGVGTAPFARVGGDDAFVWQLDANGAFVSLQQIGGSQVEQAFGMLLDGAGGLFVLGRFQGVTDFDPGTGITSVASNRNAGNTADTLDGFMLKLASATVVVNNAPMVAVDGGGSAPVGFDNHFTGNSGSRPAGWSDVIVDPSPGTGFVESGTTVTITDGRSNGPTLMQSPTFGAVSALTTTVYVASASGPAGTEPTMMTAVGGLAGRVLLVQFNTVTKRFDASVLSNGASVSYAYTLAAGEHLPAYAGGAFNYAIVAGTHGFHVTSGGYDSGELLYSAAGVVGFTTLAELGTTNAVLLGTECGGSTANGTLCSIAYDRLVVTGTGVGGSTTVTVAEGSPATKTGTFSDADGNATVTLTASAGVITQDNAGTWSWSATGADGPATSTVTITATDTASAVATADFTFTVTNVVPTVSITAPATAIEDASVSFTFTAADVSSADQAAGFAWALDFGDGTTEAVAVGTASPLGRTHTFADPGTYTVTVTATDKNSGASTQASHEITIATAVIPQTITFTNPGGKTFGDAPFGLVATGGGSGEPVTFSIVSGPASVSGSTLTITGAGDVTVRASQAGAGEYAAATPVDRTFTVAKAAQSISFTLRPRAATTSTITLAATGGASGNAVTFSVFSGPGSLAGDALTFSDIGTVVVRASQAGNANYEAAAAVDASINVVLNAVLIAVDDAVVSTTGMTTVYPLANDSDADGDELTITAVSEGSVTIDGRTLIVPAEYVGTFSYTVSDGISSDSGDVVVTARPAQTARNRWSGLLTDGDGAIVGRMSATRSTKGTFSASVRVGATTFVSTFSLRPEPNGTAIVPTTLGNLTVTEDDAAGRLNVSLAHSGGPFTGSLRRSALTGTAQTHNVALASIDAAYPGGGIARVSVRSTGFVVLTVTMPDGKTLSAKSDLADNGTFSIYSPVGRTSPTAYVGGEFNFANLAATDLTGELAWLKPAQTAAGR